MNCFDPVQRSCEKISTSACLGTWPLSKKMDGNCVHFSQIHCTDRCTAQQFGCIFSAPGSLLSRARMTETSRTIFSFIAARPFSGTDGISPNELSKKALEELHEKLSAFESVRIHRSVVVNVAYIEELRRCVTCTGI